jgi:transposase, IS5 family
MMRIIQIKLVFSVFAPKMKKTRKQEFLDEMTHVVPWVELIGLVEAFNLANKTSQNCFATGVMLRIHFMQQWFELTDSAMEEALYTVPLYRTFAGLSCRTDGLPSLSAISSFRSMLELHNINLHLLGRITRPWLRRD